MAGKVHINCSEKYFFIFDAEKSHGLKYVYKIDLKLFVEYKIIKIFLIILYYNYW